MKRKGFKNKNINIFTLLAIYLFFGVVFILIVIGTDISKYRVSDLFDINAAKVNNELSSIMKTQNDTIKKLREVSKNTNYNFNEPYVLVNPFNFNPCSAIMVFNTKEVTKVSLEINDRKVGTTESSSLHFIPIYGLDENSYNRVVLTLEDGSTHEEFIKTDGVYSNIKIEKTNRDENSLLLSYFDTGTMTAIYGYNNYNTINFMISGLNYISTFNVNDGYLTLEYNSKRDVSTILVDVDYFGRILKVYKKDKDYSSDNGVLLNMYSNGVKEYNFDFTKNVESYTQYSTLDLDSVQDKLNKALLYSKDFNVSFNLSYVTYNIEESGYLILVRSDGMILSYYIDDAKVINVSPDYSYSLFLLTDNTYYNLYTTLNK